MEVFDITPEDEIILEDDFIIGSDIRQLILELNESKLKQQKRDSIFTDSYICLYRQLTGRSE